LDNINKGENDSNSKEVFVMFLRDAFSGGSLWGGLISGGLSQLQDTNALKEGQIDKKAYAVQTTENVTGAFGVMAGIEYGAILGTYIMPGVGTVLGSVVGGLLGDRVGRTVGHRAGSSLINSRMMQNKLGTTQGNEPNAQLQGVNG
jgi:outer membrane lipoprotein SlyB